jgi:hypothetical protein
MSTDQAQIERLRERGVTGLTSVEEILEGEDRVTPLPPTRFSPARLEGTPELPPAGLYFGMPDDVYHALPALSNHGIKLLAASPMIFWSRTPWLSPKKQREVAEKLAEEQQHHIIGKAYHCLIMEGRDEFNRRFVVGLDPADYPNALVHTDQIKAAIMRHTETVPVKPCSARKDELLDQLRRLIEVNGPPLSNPEVLDAYKVDDLKTHIRTFTCEQPVKPWAKVADTMPDSEEEYQRQCVKADWIKQLLELEPEAEIFDVLQQRHFAEHAGKSIITFEQSEQLEIAAAMIARDPEVQDAFKGGYAEVTIIWYCEKTGVPMKARLDYLKPDEIVDLKTVGNQRDRSIEQAIRFEIAGYHYNFQPIVYFEAVEAARELVRKHGASVVNSFDLSPEAHQDRVEFTLKWAKSKAPVEFLWVFQQKGDAPITRGVRFPRTGLVHTETDFWIDRAKRHFIQFSEVYGTAPWLDVKPIYTIADEDIPRQATEI